MLGGLNTVLDWILYDQINLIILIRCMYTKVVLFLNTHLGNITHNYLSGTFVHKLKRERIIVSISVFYSWDPPDE